MSAFDRYASRRRRGGRRRGLGRTGQPYRKPFTFTNIMDTREASGSYEYFNRRRKRIYVGSSTNIRRRLEDTKRRRGDVRTVPGRESLPDEIAYFDVHYDKDKWKNREREMKLKRTEQPTFNVR